MEETKDVKKEEVDDKGVPLANRFKEFERKMEEKYEKRLEEQRRELEELKNMRLGQVPPQTNIDNNPEQLAKAELMDVVKGPKDFVRQVLQEERFKNQVPEAEAWLARQKGYSTEARARVDALIFENKLNTPWHMPMERAQMAWKLYEAETLLQKKDSDTDEQRREASARETGGEGKGKTIPKNSVNVHNELIKRLAAAEAKGDMDESIKIMDLLQDHPMENSVIRG